MDPEIRAEIEWESSLEADRVANAAKRKAWYEFSQKYPHADRSKFFAHVWFLDGHKATAEINYKTSDGHTVNVISADTKNLSPDIKSALGMIAPPKHLTPKARKILGPPSEDSSGGFPLQLTPITDSVAYLPIPAIPFQPFRLCEKILCNSGFNRSRCCGEKLPV